MKRAFALILAVMMLFVGASCDKAADVADDLPLDELAVKDGIEQKYYRFDIDKQQPSKNLDFMRFSAVEIDDLKLTVQTVEILVIAVDKDGRKWLFIKPV